MGAPVSFESMKRDLHNLLISDGQCRRFGLAGVLKLNITQMQNRLLTDQSRQAR